MRQQQQKSGGKEWWRVWGKHSEGRRRRRRRRRMRLKLSERWLCLPKMPSVSHGTEQTRGKEKKREKKEWNSERLKYGQPQSNRGISGYIKTNTAYLSPGINLYTQSNNTWTGVDSASDWSVTLFARSLARFPHWHDASHNAAKVVLLFQNPHQVQEQHSQEDCVHVGLAGAAAGVHSITTARSNYQSMAHSSKSSKTLVARRLIENNQKKIKK